MAVYNSGRLPGLSVGAVLKATNKHECRPLSRPFRRVARNSRHSHVHLYTQNDDDDNDHYDDDDEQYNLSGHVYGAVIIIRAAISVASDLRLLDITNLDITNRLVPRLHPKRLLLSTHTHTTEM